MILTNEEKEIIISSLHLRRNYIESGNVVLSAADAFEQGEKVKPLTESQMRLILTINDLIRKLYKED